ncbi:hypothetical protein BDV59DRAFT_168493 [Aspergillus ambiguus]|uniref:uncharacterized protein n=1 Tax=Aspergillus ambiguus TaxID=176160 RepID=UPI003CCCF9E9
MASVTSVLNQMPSLSLLLRRASSTTSVAASQSPNIRLISSSVLGKSGYSDSRIIFLLSIQIPLNHGGQSTR